MSLPPGYMGLLGLVLRTVLALPCFGVGNPRNNGRKVVTISSRTRGIFAFTQPLCLGVSQVEALSPK